MSTAAPSQPSQLNKAPDPNATLNGQSRPANPIEPTAPPPRRWVTASDPSSPENKPRARTLVLCFDGTGDQFTDYNSNVVKLVSLLKKGDSEKKGDSDHQLVYYQSGIDGYEFLMQNYSRGDKISIFGFSRGAYTARALAGMIQKVGLLTAGNEQQIPFAWALYKREDDDGLKLCIDFKKSFSLDVKVDFVGVWDTVASVGITSRELPFVGNNHSIRVFRHAIALDEHRAKFMPNFYHAAKTKTTVLTTGSADTEGSGASTNVAPKIHRDQSESQALEEATNPQSRITTHALEVWFAGAHCDVGGGSVTNKTHHALARIPLRWMIRQCFRTNTGIIFDADLLKEIGLDPATIHLPRPERIPAPSHVHIKSPGLQPSAIVTLLKFIGSVMWIPVDFVLSVAVWPFKHLWFLVRFSEHAKLLRRKLGMKPPTTRAVQDVHVDVNVSRPPATVNEEVEEWSDALEPIYDQLQLVWWWRIVEWLPLAHRSQKGKRTDYYVRWNLWKGRKIYGNARAGGLKIHRSVKTRLEVMNKETGESVYKPSAWFRYRKQHGGEKLEGPETWNIDEPDHHRQWEWVE